MGEMDLEICCPVLRLIVIKRVWQLAQAHAYVLECVYPQENARIDVDAGGIMKQAIDNKSIVNVYNSLDDRRVLSSCDAMDFLNVVVSDYDATRTGKPLYHHLDVGR